MKNLKHIESVINMDVEKVSWTLQSDSFFVCRIIWNSMRPNPFVWLEQRWRGFSLFTIGPYLGDYKKIQTYSNADLSYCNLGPYVNFLTPSHLPLTMCFSCPVYAIVTESLLTVLQSWSKFNTETHLFLSSSVISFVSPFFITCLSNIRKTFISELLER